MKSKWDIINCKNCNHEIYYSPLGYRHIEPKDGIKRRYLDIKCTYCDCEKPEK